MGNIERTPKEKGQILNKLRLAWGMAYDELGEFIYQVTHLRRNADTWRKICLGETDDPHATTLSILDTFLAIHTSPRAKRLRRQQYPAARKAS